MSFPSDEHASELRELFFESAEEILQGMNEAGLALEKHPRDAEQLRHVRRAVHTLKGDSAACGFRELSELAHELEDVLTPEVAEQNAATIAEVVLTAADTFHEMLAAYRNKLQPPAGDALREHILRLLDATAAPRSQDPASHAKFDWTEYERLMIAEAFGRGETVYNVALHIDPETPLPAAAFELGRKALEGVGKILALRPEKGAATDQVRLIEAAISSVNSPDVIRSRCHVPSVVRKCFNRPHRPRRSPSRATCSKFCSNPKPPRSPLASSRGAPRQACRPTKKLMIPRVPAGLAHATAENTLRVDAGRIDTVMNLVGELIIGKSMLQRAIAEFERSHAKDPLRAKICRRARVPVARPRRIAEIGDEDPHGARRAAFPPLPAHRARRRQAAQQRHRLEIAGQNTDLDKSILDALAEPLAHLVRNAADHGIETAAERQAAGKPARGTIRLNAYHDGDQVVIEVSDDGRGLDRDKIVRRAIERGILTAERSAPAERVGGSAADFHAGPQHRR